MLGMKVDAINDDLKKRIDNLANSLQGIFKDPKHKKMKQE